MSTNAWRLGWGVTAAILFLAALACETPPPSASGDPASPTVAAATATPKPDFDAGVILDEFPDGHPRNEVRLENRDDLRFKARANIKLHRIKGDDILPVNLAFAQGKCTNCQTIAVAVQVVLYKRGATNIQPQNIAIASNVGCTRCVTVARAIQYVIPVDDFDQVPDRVKELVKRIDKEVRFLASIKTFDQITSDEAQHRIQRALDDFAELHQYLIDLMSKKTLENEEGTEQRGPADQQGSPTPTPTGTAAPAGSGSPVPASPSATPTESPRPPASPTATP